ncbi:MAG: hypothetical protein ACYTFY_20655, partial [Planctomycetota bacterium]
MSSDKSAVGTEYPLKVVTVKDRDTGTVAHRFIHNTPSQEQIFYYSSPAMTEDGRYLPCWSNVSGLWQIHAIDREKEVSVQLSALTPGFEKLDGYFSDVPCLSREYNRVFYHDRRKTFWTSLDGKEEGWVFEAPEGFRLTSLSARGKYISFSYLEEMTPPVLPEGCKIKGRPQQTHFPLSIVFAIDIETGAGEYVWGGHNYFGHVETSPFDQNQIMFVDQSMANWQQEIYVVARELVDDKQAKKVFAGNFPDYKGRTMDYIGHSFYTQDGFIAGQYSEMGGVEEDNTYSDRSEFNFVIRPDGTLKRKAKFPGSDGPCHVHCQKAEGLWVGDHWVKEDGTMERDWLSIIKNDFKTQEMKSTPLLRTNHYMGRPWHIHPWISDKEDMVVCSFNTGAVNGDIRKGTAQDNHMAIIEIG